MQQMEVYQMIRRMPTYHADLPSARHADVALFTSGLNYSELLKHGGQNCEYLARHVSNRNAVELTSSGVDAARRRLHIFGNSENNYTLNRRLI